MPIVNGKWEPSKGASPEDHKVLTENLGDVSDAIHKAQQVLQSIIAGEAWEIASNALRASQTLIISARMQCHALEQRDKKSGM